MLGRKMGLACQLKCADFSVHDAVTKIYHAFRSLDYDTPTCATRGMFSRNKFAAAEHEARITCEQWMQKHQRSIGRGEHKITALARACRQGILYNPDGTRGLAPGYMYAPWQIRYMYSAHPEEL
jgi:hypothetical protein